ncbi:MAG: hypothetical protein KJP16_02090 [Gammaproteobacteria bacterium]|nr:hypothetical protein [Gammaproteobacteria bacterium]NNL49579.1 hypothetical protein [Woeseiaceae bacterium]
MPEPRAHLPRYHGVLAPASRDRARIVPRTHAVAERGEAAATDRQRAMSWAQRLRRVFAIDIETCRQCGDPTGISASSPLSGITAPILL